MNKIFSTLAVAAVALGFAVPALAANKTVRVADDVFKASIVTINKGNTVTWNWVGNSPHNVKFASFGSALKVNGTYRHTFRKRGTFRYRCTIHSGMTGKVIVQ
ncbi:MAG: plastocyanin/azurin family copper-binding protein [Solirubrobacteraceae bacterium]